MRAHFVCDLEPMRLLLAQDAANMKAAKRAAMIANDLAECEVFTRPIIHTSLL